MKSGQGRLRVSMRAGRNHLLDAGIVRRSTAMLGAAFVSILLIAHSASAANSMGATSDSISGSSGSPYDGTASNLHYGNTPPAESDSNSVSTSAAGTAINQPGIAAPGSSNTQPPNDAETRHDDDRTSWSGQAPGSGAVPGTSLASPGSSTSAMNPSSAMY